MKPEREQFVMAEAEPPKTFFVSIFEPMAGCPNLPEKHHAQTLKEVGRKHWLKCVCCYAIGEQDVEALRR